MKIQKNDDERVYFDGNTKRLKRYARATTDKSQLKPNVTYRASILSMCACQFIGSLKALVVATADPLDISTAKQRYLTIMSK